MEVDDSKVNTPDEVLQDENETPIDNENEEDYDEGDMLHEDDTLVRNTLDNYKTWKENVPYLYDIMIHHYSPTSSLYIDWGHVQEGDPRSHNIATSQYMYTSVHYNSKYNETARTWSGPADQILVSMVDISRPSCTNLWHLGRFNDYQKNHLFTFAKRFIHPGPIEGIKACARNMNILFSFNASTPSSSSSSQTLNMKDSTRRTLDAFDPENPCSTNIWNTLKQTGRIAKPGVEANTPNSLLHHPAPLQVKTFRSSPYCNTIVSLDKKNQLVKWNIDNLNDPHFSETFNAYAPSYCSAPSEVPLTDCEYFYKDGNMKNLSIASSNNGLVYLYDDRADKTPSMTYALEGHPSILCLSTHYQKENEIAVMDTNKTISIYDIRNMNDAGLVQHQIQFFNDHPTNESTNFSSVHYLSDQPDYLYAMTNSCAIDIYNIKGINGRHKIFSHTGHPCTVHGCSYNIADPWVFASISSCPIRENKDSNISDMSKPTKGCFVQVWRPHELIHVDLSNEEELKKYMDLYEK